MEALPQRPVEGETPSDHLLPGGRNRVARISAQTRGLFEDFTSWVELRMKLLQAEIQDKIQSKVHESVIKVAPFAAAAITGLFGLVTSALFLGWWLGHPAWGFLIVTTILCLVTGALLARKRRFEKEQRSIAASSTNGAARSSS